MSHLLWILRSADLYAVIFWRLYAFQDTFFCFLCTMCLRTFGKNLVLQCEPGFPQAKKEVLKATPCHASEISLKVWFNLQTPWEHTLFLLASCLILDHTWPYLIWKDQWMQFKCEISYVSDVNETKTVRLRWCDRGWLFSFIYTTVGL